MLDRTFEPPASAIPERRQFSCLRLDDGGGARLALAGELDIATTPELEAELGQADPARRIVLDLRGLRFIDCGALRVLLAAHRRARLARGRLIVVRGPADVERLLAIIGVDLEFECVDRPPNLYPVIEAAAR